MSQKKTTGDYYSNGEKNSCTYLKLKRNKKYYNYVNEIQDIKLTYHRNSLDLFGIQPGLELYDRKLSSPDEDWEESLVRSSTSPVCRIQASSSP